MTKVLARTGVSLADVYDIRGSIAGVEQLEAREVQVVHEMGSTIVAERVGGFIARVTTGDLSQSETWNLLFTEFPPTPFRILGVSVMGNSGAARIAMAAVSLRQDPVITVNREIPIFVWEDTTDPLISIRWVNNGAAVTEWSYLRQTSPIPGMPSMGFGSTARRDMPTCVFRGATTAFGAGTVEVVAQVYGVWMEVGGGVSSYGLPLPSW